MSEFKVTGQVEVDKMLEKSASSLFKLGSDLNTIVIKSRSRLIAKTPNDTGRTSKKWSSVKKLSNLKFLIENTMASQDGKYAIADIINYGRKEVRPIRAKRLYIPLSKRAKFKMLGAPIPADYKFGIDYVLAKKSRAVKGTFFLNKEIDKAQDELKTLIMRPIK